eukprot:1177500-Prorocentrum_minimum.AAC.1
MRTQVAVPPNMRTQNTDKIILEEAELYENQVYGWVNGWTPSEGRILAWSNSTAADGAKTREQLERSLGLLPDGWKWTGDWKNFEHNLVKNDLPLDAFPGERTMDCGATGKHTDEDGWEYSADFESLYSRSNSNITSAFPKAEDADEQASNRQVRRRRWCRTRHWKSSAIVLEVHVLAARGLIGNDLNGTLKTSFRQLSPTSVYIGPNTLSASFPLLRAP